MQSKNNKTNNRMINLKEFKPEIRTILSSHNLFVKNAIRKLDSPFKYFYQCYICSSVFVVYHSNEIVMLDYSYAQLLTCKEAQSLQTIKEIIE